MAPAISRQCSKGRPVSGVEVDSQFVRAVEVLDAGIPRVEVEHPQLNLLDDVCGVLDVGHVSRTSRRKLDSMSVRISCREARLVKKKSSFTPPGHRFNEVGRCHTRGPPLRHT